MPVPAWVRIAGAFSMHPNWRSSTRTLFRDSRRRCKKQPWPGSVQCRHVRQSNECFRDQTDIADRESGMDGCAGVAAQQIRRRSVVAGHSNGRVTPGSEPHRLEHGLASRFAALAGGVQGTYSHGEALPVEHGNRPATWPEALFDAHDLYACHDHEDTADLDGSRRIKELRGIRSFGSRAPNSMATREAGPTRRSRSA